MNRIKNFFSTERAKLREMTFAEKRWYIWEYYKFHIFAIIIGGFLLGSLINSWLNPPPDDYLYIAWLGIPAHHFQLMDFAEEFTEKIVEDPERQIVSITDYSFTDNFQMNHALQARFIAMMQLRGLDMILSTQTALEGMADAGHIRTIDEIMVYLAEINPQLHAYLLDSGRIVPLTFPRKTASACCRKRNF